MADKMENSVSSEVESRLEEFFRGDDDAADFQDPDDSTAGEDGAVDFQNPGDSNDSSDNELRDLKALVLSIDWEINDEIMTGLMEEIQKLTPLYEDDRILALFLQLLGSVGKYIKTNKSNAHPKSVKLLNSVYSSFEKAVRSNDLTDADKKQLLMEEVDNFKETKKQIALGKRVSGRETKKPAKTEMSPELAAALEEIKTTILREIRSLKEELRLWRNGE